jgi:hypothetical protein
MDKIAMSSGSGGGEVRLEFLDDVDRATAKVNGKFLKYDSASKKFVGADAGGGLTVKEEGSNVGTAVDTIDFVGATVTATGNTTTIQVQSAAVGNNISTTLQTQHIIPASNNTFDLGSTTKRFQQTVLVHSRVQNRLHRDSGQEVGVLLTVQSSLHILLITTSMYYSQTQIALSLLN